MIISAYKPVRQLPPEHGDRRAVPRRPARRRRAKHAPISWENFFLRLDRVLKWADKVVPGVAGGSPAIRAAHRWMLDHFENSDGLGAIFPPMIYTVVALGCLGYDRDSAAMPLGAPAARRPADRGGRHDPGPALPLAGLGHGDRHDRPGRLAACPTTTRPAPVGPLAPGEGGPGRRATGRPGGSTPSRPAGTSSSTTSTIPTSTTRRWSSSPSTPRRSATTPRSRPRPTGPSPGCWRCRTRDGGWAAYDRDINNQVLTKVTFADHNAMLDPSCADITARVVEMLGTLGHRADHPAIARALAYLWQTQEPEGCWYGRWGVNYIYGTWQVLQGLKAIDFPMDHPAVVRACRLARVGPAGRRRLGRDLPELRRPVLQGPGRPDPVADRLGRPRPGLRRPGRRRGRPPGRPVPPRHPEGRRHLGRRRPTPGPASRGSSTSGITSTRSRSR